MKGTLKIESAVGKDAIEALGFVADDTDYLHIYTRANAKGDAVRGSVICVRRSNERQIVVNVCDSYWTFIKAFTFQRDNQAQDSVAFCKAAVMAEV